jgi:protein tyrosine phosphatase
MVWQEKTLVIVMTTKLKEGKTTKCYPYWPRNQNEIVVHGELEIQAVAVESNRGYTTTLIRTNHAMLFAIQTHETRKLTHFYITSWPDNGVPSSSKFLLDFIRIVKEKQAEMMNVSAASWTRNGPPIVVHCSAGVGRTGTFIATFISMDRWIATKAIDVKGTVAKLRSQRFMAVIMQSQYEFCYKAIAKFAGSSMN